MKLVVQGNTKKAMSYKYWPESGNVVIFSPIAPTALKEGPPAVWIDTKHKDVLLIVNKLMSAFEDTALKEVIITVGGRDGFNKIAYQLYEEYVAKGRSIRVGLYREKGTYWGIVRKKTAKKLLGRGEEVNESATASA